MRGRRSAESVRPLGFWNVGIVYRNDGGSFVRRSSRSSASGSRPSSIHRERDDLDSFAREDLQRAVVGRRLDEDPARPARERPRPRRARSPAGRRRSARRGRLDASGARRSIPGAARTRRPGRTRTRSRPRAGRPRGRIPRAPRRGSAPAPARRGRTRSAAGHAREPMSGGRIGASLRCRPRARIGPMLTALAWRTAVDDRRDRHTSRVRPAEDTAARRRRRARRRARRSRSASSRPGCPAPRAPPSWPEQCPPSRR